MKFRFARHTNQLTEITRFYQRVLLLDVIGSFENHNNYNGVFLGKSNIDWELEFTESTSETDHQFDDDDLLVFYVSETEIEVIQKKLAIYNISRQTPKNPYWNDMGIYFKDPDGYGIIIAREDKRPIT